MRFATLALATGAFVASAASAQTAQTLPFTQNWNNVGLITANDDWSGVPGIVGYLGDFSTATPTPPVVPDTFLVAGPTAIDVIANGTTPNTVNTGGVGEYELTDPVVALQGSGTADAPYLLIRVVTTGLTNIRVRYNARDIDGAADNSVQPIALQYRVGTSGTFTNVASAYIADASTGPSLATLVTPVDVVLPANAENQASLDIRIMTGNAIGSDEWIGIDDIQVTSGTTASEAGAGATALRLDVPNPIQGATMLRYDLPAAGAARLAVYDVLGRQVALLADGQHAAGAELVTFDPSGLAPGVYVLRLQAGDAAVTRLVTVTR